MYQGFKIIINPISGSGRGLTEGLALSQFLQQHGLEVDVSVTSNVGDAEYEAARAKTPLIVIGGDGTVNEVINGLEGRRIPFLVLPTGTANLLSREFGLPRTREGFFSLIQSGGIHLLDAGHLRGQVSRRFLSVASIGLDAEVVRLMRQIRTGSIHLYSYLIPLWKALKAYPCPSFTVIIDDHTIVRPVTTAIISNIRNYAGYFSVARQARADDGWLDICTFPGKRKRDYLRYMAGVALSHPSIFPDVVCYRGRKIEVRSTSPIPVELDGDFAGYTPVVCQVIPKSVPLILPDRKYSRIP
ncbi:MAG: diacylglycerol/lipid kinase family protein [bacterium]